MNNYQQKDQLGRDIFKGFCEQQKWCKFVKEAEDDFSTWDVAYVSGRTNNVIGEIKFRKNYSCDSFTDVILEYDKYKSLINKGLKAKEKGKEIKVTYINIFNNNFTYVFNLTDLDIEKLDVKMLYLPKNNFDDTQVWKKVIYLPTYYAEKYETDEELSIFKNTKCNEDNDEDYLPF